MRAIKRTAVGALLVCALTVTTSAQKANVSGVAIPANPASRRAAAPRAAPRPLELPVDVAGVRDSEPSDALATLTKPCELQLGLSARMTVSGQFRGRNVRTQLRLSLVPGLGTRIEPVARSGPPPFVLYAKQDDAALFIRSGNRVVHDGFPNLMEAAVGVHVSERELLELLMACPMLWDSNVTHLGPDWFRRVSLFGEESMLEIYVHRDGPSAPWRYAAAIHQRLQDTNRSWRADFLERRHDVFQRLRIRSLNWIGEVDGVYDLTLTRDFASFYNFGPVAGAPVSPTATDTTLGDLKSSLPLIIAPLR
jgi:hypothetical protein